MLIGAPAASRGIVEVVQLPGWAAADLVWSIQDPSRLEGFLSMFAERRTHHRNLVFNFPREQYSKIDRGETPEAVNAQYLTLTNTNLTNPATTTVPGETLRVQTSTQIIDSSDPKTTIIRFILAPGQFTGSYTTAALIGGAAATLTPGTGKIVAAVNNIKDDTGAVISRDGTSTHLITWKLSHLDASEV